MHKKILFAIIASITATNAYSDQVLTSQKYVDDADAQKVDIAQGVGTNNANVGKTLVVNSSGNLELGTVSADNFVEDSITDGVTNKAPSENAVHDALENKQNTITTSMVAFEDPDTHNNYQLPSLVSYDSTNSLSGNQIGILDLDNGGGGLGFIAQDMDPWDSSTAVYDNYVPTVRTVAAEFNNVIGWLSDLRHDTNPIYWSTADSAAVHNYSITFTGGSTWPRDHKQQYVTGNSLAQGLALKQNRQIGALPGGYANSTDAGKVLVVGNDGKIAMGTTTVSNFQTKIPAGTAGNLVTYTGTAGTVGSVATYTGAATYNATNDANKIPTMSGVTAWAQAKKVCVRWLDTPEHPEHNDENCLLWELPD